MIHALLDRLRVPADRRPFLTRFAGVFALDVLAKALPFLLLPVFTRLMTEEEFGLYSYLFYIVTSVANVLGWGMETAQSKLAYGVSNLASLLFTINVFIFGAFAAIGVLVYGSGLDEVLFSHLVSDPRFHYAAFRVWVPLYVLLQIITVLLNVYFLVRERIRVYQFFNLAKIALMNLGALALLYALPGTDKALVRFGAEAALGILVFGWLYGYYVRQFQAKFDLDVLRRAWRIGLPVTGSVLLSLVYTVSDKYFLQKSAGLETLAAYNFAQMLAMPAVLVFLSFHSLWLPRFFKEPDLRRNFQRTQSLVPRLLAGFALLLVGLWVGVGLLLWAGYLKPAYSPVLVLLPILFLGRVLESVAHLYNNFVVMLEKTTFTLLLAIGLSTLTLALNYTLIPRFGSYAAAGITVGVMLTRAVVLLGFARRRARHWQADALPQDD